MIFLCIFFFYISTFSCIVFKKRFLLFKQLINRNQKAPRCSVTQLRQLLYNVPTKLLKGAVVTTKPRRSRKGRGAAAIIKKIQTISTPKLHLGGRAVCAGQESFATQGRVPLRRSGKKKRQFLGLLKKIQVLKTGPVESDENWHAALK